MLNAIDFLADDTEPKEKESISIYDTSSLHQELDKELIKQEHIQAIKKGYIPYSFNECYGKQITNNAYVYIHRIDQNLLNWTSYRLTYNYMDNDIKSEKTIIEGQDLLQVLDKTEKYIDNYLDFISK